MKNTTIAIILGLIIIAALGWYAMQTAKANEALRLELNDKTAELESSTIQINKLTQDRDSLQSLLDGNSQQEAINRLEIIIEDLKKQLAEAGQQAPTGNTALKKYNALINQGESALAAGNFSNAIDQFLQAQQVRGIDKDSRTSVKLKIEEARKSMKSHYIQTITEAYHLFKAEDCQGSLEKLEQTDQVEKYKNLKKEELDPIIKERIKTIAGKCV